MIGAAAQDFAFRRDARVKLPALATESPLKSSRQAVA
jgi:hypothetical protein